MSQLVYVVGEPDPTGSGVVPLAVLLDRGAAEAWARAWDRREQAAGRLALSFRQYAEVHAVRLDPPPPDELLDSEVVAHEN